METRGTDFGRERRRKGDRANAGIHGGRGPVDMVRKLERITLFRFMKQNPSRRWFSDASYQAVGGYFWKRGCGRDFSCH